MRKDYVEIDDDLFEVRLLVGGRGIGVGEANWRVVTQRFSPALFSGSSLKNDNIGFFSR